MPPRIYTKRGDDGTTGLLYGGRVRKDSWRIELNGAVDEAQAAIGLARAETAAGSEVNERLTALARDLYVLMAEVATAPENRAKLTAGSTLVTPDMVAALEASDRRPARALRHAERLHHPGREPRGRRPRPGPHRRSPGRAAGRGRAAGGSYVVPYLNRLSDLLWAMARWQEGPEHALSKRV